MMRGISRAWPVVLALSAVSAGMAMFVSWHRWGRYEAAAHLVVEESAGDQFTHGGQEIEAFLNSVSFEGIESSSPGSPGNGRSTVEVSVYLPHATITSSAPSAVRAIRDANRFAEIAAASWNRTALDRERARMQSLETERERLEEELSGLREKETGLRSEHRGVGSADEGHSRNAGPDRIARELAEAEHRFAYLQGQRDRLEEEMRRSDTESDEEYLARVDPAVSAAATRLRELRRKLHNLRARYTEKNPLVESTLRRIEEEETAYRKAVEGARESGTALEPPRERVLRSELAAVERDLEEERGRLTRLRAEIDAAEEKARTRLAQQPVLEKQLEEIERREQQKQERLRGVRDERDRILSLASSGKGFLPRLRVEAAAASARPAGGIRIVAAGILGGGAAFALAMLLTAAGNRHRRRESARGLSERLGVPILATFPRRS